MEIPINRNIELQFRIDDDAPSEFRKRWDKLRLKVYGGENKNKKLTRMWLNRCKMDSNKNLCLLDRSEGGVGGNNNIENKQIRYKEVDSYTVNTPVSMYVYSTESQMWTFEELLDLKRAFEKISREAVKEDCIRGIIAIS